MHAAAKPEMRLALRRDIEAGVKCCGSVPADSENR